MESSYVPPEVAAQYAQSDDQSATEGQDEQASSSQSDPNSTLGDDSSGHSLPGGVPGLSGSDPVGQNTGDTHATPGATESLTLKQQLQMLSPLGLLRALTGDIFGEKSQEEQQAEQMRNQRQQQLNMQNRQASEMQRQQTQAEQQQIAQQVETLKSQGKAFTRDASSVIFSQTTRGDLSELSLTEQAVKDAQREVAKRRQGGLADPGSKAKQGPSSMGDLAQQKSGMQKASEMSMGE